MSDYLYNLIIKRRSVRLFKQKKVPKAIIRKVINSARVAPSAANLQFLEYLAVTDKKLLDKIFDNIRWAGYIRPLRTPPEENRPVLYIFILINTKKSREYDLRDVGAAAENILLSLSAYGLGSCWIGSIERKSLEKIFNIPNHYKIDSVIAAGYPAESPKLETDPENVRYWLDKKNVLHVPKRPLKNILFPGPREF